MEFDDVIVLPKSESAKLRIAEALEEALRTCAFDSLSVGQICACAGISRPTFYKYFRSKREVALWMISFLVRPGDKTQGSFLKEQRTWDDFYRRCMDRSALLLGLAQSRHSENFVDETQRQLLLALDGELALPAIAGDGRATQAQVLAEGFTRALALCLWDWLRQGMPVDGHAMAKYTVSTIPRALAQKAV